MHCLGKGRQVFLNPILDYKAGRAKLRNAELGWWKGQQNHHISIKMCPSCKVTEHNSHKKYSQGITKIPLYLNQMDNVSQCFSSLLGRPKYTLRDIRSFLVLKLHPILKKSQILYIPWTKKVICKHREQGEPKNHLGFVPSPCHISSIIPFFLFTSGKA